jgi:putative phage-type endonuclease
MSLTVHDVWPAADAVGPNGMTRPDWLEWRRNGIGASDIASILRLPGAYSTPYQVWTSKVYPPVDDQTNDWLDFGRHMEHAIRPWVEERTGLALMWPGLLLADPVHPWRRVSLDDVAYDTHDAHANGDRPVAIIEIKTAPWKTWDDIPLHYQAQAQYQMAIASIDHTNFAVLHGRHLEIYELEADPVDQAAILAAVDEFWTDVQQGVAPAIRAGDAAALVERWPVDNGDTVTLPDWLLKDLRFAREQLTHWTQLGDEIACRLRAAMADATTAIDADGHVVATWKVERDRPAIDPRAEKQAKPRSRVAPVPEKARRFYEPTGSRVLRIVDKADR